MHFIKSVVPSLTNANGVLGGASVSIGFEIPRLDFRDTTADHYNNTTVNIPEFAAQHKVRNAAFEF